MSTASELIEGAFKRLAERPGFVLRADQQQLAHLLSDMIEGDASGAFEAPTGLGKSLAALIPAIAHAITEKKRTIIATYTNVLAEQYWRQDLPLALSLFDLGGSGAGSEPPLRTQFLIGRQRYACLAAIQDTAPQLKRNFVPRAQLGIETELREHGGISGREVSRLWPQIATPPVCPGRLCSHYNSCFYYNARRAAEKAEVVITNHSVVIQHALMARAGDETGGLLGEYDFLILDEAHDFPQAALNGLEFELSQPKLAALLGIGTRMEKTLAPYAESAGDMLLWAGMCDDFRKDVERCQRAIVAYSLRLGQPGILNATPPEVMDHPQVQAAKTSDGIFGAQRIADEVSKCCIGFVEKVQDVLTSWRDQGIALGMVAESVRNYSTYIAGFGGGCVSLFNPEGVAVSYVGRTGEDAMLRSDLIGLAQPLQDLVWSRGPYACMSATLALDGSFDFFKRTTGAEPDFEEILPSPFDFTIQAAVYLPKAEIIPDPSTARREGLEEEYYAALARELSEIIQTLEGRTLALFHSRREMEGVMKYISLPPELPILMQFRSGAGSTGEQFIKNVNASLFALRSFWTGFDAPGETLSCVALVRVPFEVPVDPPQIARMAWMQTLGLDPFQEHSLPQAKMLMRQGAGRLIRRSEDKGIIALLDPRLRTKRYGEAILANLPPGMRTFDDFADAAGWLGLGRRLAI